MDLLFVLAVELYVHVYIHICTHIYMLLKMSIRKDIFSFEYFFPLPLLSVNRITVEGRHDFLKSFSPLLTKNHLFRRKN